MSYSMTTLDGGEIWITEEQVQALADVVQAVNFARKHRLLLAVRGAGHNIAGNAVCDGGLLVDLSAMKSVSVSAGSAESMG